MSGAGDRGMEPMLVLQHIACEPPAAYEQELELRGIELHRVELDEGEPLPDWRGHSAIIAMGGPMGTYDESAHPWLAGEKRAIAEAVAAGLPFWGVCLGAQLLAASLGARVFPGDGPEVGVLPITLTEQAREDPVFAAAPDSFPSLHWHGDTYELPPGALRLAGSARYEQQAFVVGRAYALQFHLEVDAELLSDWARVPAYADSLVTLGQEDPMASIIAQVRASEATTTPLARELFGRWLELVVGLPALP